jgi:hypothetical protein
VSLSVDLSGSGGGRSTDVGSSDSGGVVEQAAITNRRDSARRWCELVTEANS